MSKIDKTYKGLKSYSSQGFILLGSTIALFIILSVFSIFLIKIVVKENQISSYNLMDIRARNLSQSGLEHGIQLFKAANSPYLGPVSKNFNNGQYTITFDPSNNETGNPLPYSHYAMTNSSASINDATRNTRLFVSSYPDAFNLAFYGNRTGSPWEALSFDRVNDRVITPIDADLQAMASTTWSGWINPIGSSGWQVIFGMEDGGWDRFLIIENGGLGLSMGMTSNRWQTGASVSPNVWQHVAAIYDNGSMRFYYNGNEYTTNSNEGNHSSAGNFTIGGNQNGNHNLYGGLIDEVAVWNEALTSSEIAAIYNYGTGLNVASNSGNYTSSTNLVGYWNFNEGSGNIAYDQSGNGNNSTINGATWSSTPDPYVGSFSQSGGTINGDIYYNGNISGINLTGTAYTSTGSGGTLHPDPLPEFPLANIAYFSSSLDTISPATGSGDSGGDDEDEVTGQIVTVTGTKGRNVSGSVFPTNEVNYLCCGMVYWWEVKVEFQPIGSNTTFFETYGENTRNSTRSWNWSIKDHIGNATQVIVKNIWIRGDFAAGSEYLTNVTIGGHNFGRMDGIGDDGTWDIEYSHDGSDGTTTCDDCVTKSYGKNQSNTTISWNFDVTDNFSLDRDISVTKIWVRGDLNGNNEKLRDVTVGGHNFGTFRSGYQDGVWREQWSGTEIIQIQNRDDDKIKISSSVNPTSAVNFTPSGAGNWWQIKVEFYQEPEPEGGGTLELTNNFNLNNTFPNGLYYGSDISMTGLTVSGSGKIYATGNINITNCTITGGIEIASNGEINISNSTLGSNVNSMANSVVLFTKGGISISGSNVRGLILNQGPDLTVSGSSNVKGALYTCSTTTNISSSTVTGSVVSKYGVNLNNSTINKGSLPPTFGLSFGFEPMIIPGSYLEY